MTTTPEPTVYELRFRRPTKVWFDGHNETINVRLSDLKEAITEVEVLLGTMKESEARWRRVKIG